ncbi:MAG: N-acetylmuramoyl-L-alanine amidase [Verrucomicrobiota bacterium]
MLKPAGIIFIAVFFLAGCATAPPRAPYGPLPPNWPATNEVQKPQMPQPPRPLAPAVYPKPPPTNAARPAPVITWTSLSRWAAEHEIGAPHLLSELPVTTYAIGSTNGVMVLEIGSREAVWNGVEINLGFEPQLIDNQVFLHGLDLRRNLEPLLCDPPLTFGTNRVIVVDPGHGGSNTGTHSVLDGRLEKEFTLAWALQLKPLLETNGWTVFLTRTNDEFVANSDRDVFADAHHADLFISLHFNSTASRETDIRGLETYCLTPTGMPSSLIRGYNDFWSDNYPNNGCDAENLQLAVRLHTALLRATDLEDRGVQRARFMGVLDGQHCPAVLIEGGYLSNPHEAKLIETPEFRQKLAEAVANALK